MIPTEELAAIVTESTKKASIREWKAVQGDDSIPVYNYRLDHVKQVVALSEIIALEEGADLDVIRYSAWLHDIAKPGLGGIKEHAKKSAEMAQGILADRKVDPETIRRAADTISKHAGLTLEERLSPIEAQIIWEADKLSKLGVIGFVHHIINGLRLEPGMEIGDIAKSVREFLPLAEEISKSMYTRVAQQIARERLEHLRNVSSFLDDELRSHQGDV